MSLGRDFDKLVDKAVPKLSFTSGENVYDSAKFQSRKNSTISADQSSINNYNMISNTTGVTSNSNMSHLDLAIAIFDFNDTLTSNNKANEATSNSKRLYFKKTDIIYVFSKHSNGWWDGLRIIEPNNKVERGWFPSTFVKVLKENVHCTIYSKNHNILNSVSRRPSVAYFTDQLNASRRSSNVGLKTNNTINNSSPSIIQNNNNTNNNNILSNENIVDTQQKDKKQETFIALPVPIINNNKSRRTSLHPIYTRRHSTHSFNSKSSPVRRNSLLSRHSSLSNPSIPQINNKNSNKFNKTTPNSNTIAVAKEFVDSNQVDPLENRYNGSSINVVSKHGSFSTTGPDENDNKKNTEQINILSLEEVEMTINSFHNPTVSTWSPIAIIDEKTQKLSSKILYYNKEFNIYCSEFPLISANDSKKFFNFNKKHPNKHKNKNSLTNSDDDSINNNDTNNSSDISDSNTERNNSNNTTKSSTNTNESAYKNMASKKITRSGYPADDHIVDLRARKLSESIFEIPTQTPDGNDFVVSDNFNSDIYANNNKSSETDIDGNFTNDQKAKNVIHGMSARLSKYENAFKSNLDEDNISKTKSLNDGSVFVKQAILCDDNLFYFHLRDIKTWAELENLTFHYAKLTHNMFLRNDNVNFSRNFSLLANMVTYIQLSCRLLQRQMKIKRLDKKIRMLLKKLIASLAHININSILYFNLEADADINLNTANFPLDEKSQNTSQTIRPSESMDPIDDTHSTMSDRTLRRSTIMSSMSGKFRSPSTNDTHPIVGKGSNKENSKNVTNNNNMRNVSIAESKETVKNKPNKNNRLATIFENIDLEFMKFMKNVHILQLTLSNGVLENGEFGRLPEILPRFFKGTFSGGSWTNPFAKFIYPIDTDPSPMVSQLPQRSGKLSVADSITSCNTIPPKISKAIALASGAYVAKDAANENIVSINPPFKTNNSISSVITGSRQGYSKTYSRARTSKRKKIYPLSADTLEEMNKIANENIENFSYRATEAFLNNQPMKTERNFELNSKTYEQINENTTLVNILENLDLTIFINLKRLIKITPESIDKESEEFLRHAMQSISVVIVEFYEIKQAFHDILIRLIISAQHTTLKDPYVFSSMKPMTQTGYSEPRLLHRPKSADSKENIKLEKCSKKLLNSLIKQDVEVNNMSFLNSSNDFIFSCERYVEVARMACAIVEQLVEERENLLNYAARTMRNNLTTELLKGEQDLWYSYNSESESESESEDTTKIGKRRQNHDYDAPWFLQNEYDFDLIYDSKGQIKGGTKEALIEHLTCHEILDPSFNLVMLISFRSIMSPREFLYSLMYRYNSYPPEGLTFDEYNMWVNQKLTPIKCRVINIMKLFFQQYWTPKYFEQGLTNIEDFIRVAVAEDIPGADQLLFKVKEILAQASEYHATNSDQNSIDEKKKKKEQTKIDRKIDINKNDSNIIFEKLLNIDPYDYAVQLTILEHGLYLRINIFECLNRAWGNKYGVMSDSNNISKFIHNANSLTNFVSYSIVCETDVHKRSRNIEFFIDVACKCKELNNYSSMTAIVSALYSSPVYRLKKTWKLVAMESTHKLNELNNLMDSKKNFLNYRNQLRLLKDVSCVPFFGIYLSDLTFTNAGNPDYLLKNHEIINFSKRVKIVDIIEEILNFKRIPYRLKKNDKIQKLIEESLRDVPHIDIQYQLSVTMEARVNTSANNNLLQERTKPNF